MALYDRDYYRAGRSAPMFAAVQSAVALIIIANVLIWILQNVFPPFSQFLGCSSSDIFQGFPQVWKLVTACFAHSTDGILHILCNMFLVFLFGRHLEEIYGKRDFLVLYLVGGAVAIFCEVVFHQVTSQPYDPVRDMRDIPILGASGSVMALVVIYGMHFPHRIVLLFGIVPMPIWLLCVLFILADLFGAIAPSSGVANVAHLGGAAFGFCYRYFDLRWVRVRSWLPSRRTRAPRRRGSRSGRGASSREDGPRLFEQRPSGGDPQSQAVSKRIDELLEKIHQEGMGSLSEEEYEFLQENSRRYRSP